MDDACLDLLLEAGVTMLSVGVESLSDRLLRTIGRSHDAGTAEQAVSRAIARGFRSVNADLMFALPGQTLNELDADLARLLDLGIDQISTYPIFGFPYTDLGASLGLEKIARPRGDVIRSMLELIARRAGEFGLKRCAVWSFIKPARHKFSSITRHHYLGFGPSAASMLGGQFRVNTFSIEEYQSSLPVRPPVALVLPVDRRLEMAYWFYWRTYEMVYSDANFREEFGCDLETYFGNLLSTMRALGLVTRVGGAYRVREGAAYWVHRVQNEYSLNYINRLWGQCRNTAWPNEVRL
jgi:oxygen-independent coproporphyrinogen-3 oxidase